jgi:hypothetical protein
VIKHLFFKGNSVRKIYNYTSITLCDKRPFYSIAKNRVARIRRGHSSPEDEERHGRQVTILENVDVLEKISAKWVLNVSMLLRRVIVCLLQKLFFTYFGGNLLSF